MTRLRFLLFLLFFPTLVFGQQNSDNGDKTS